MSIPEQVNENGYTIIENIFTKDEISHILEIIDTQKESNQNFRKSHDLFAVRSFLQEFPELKNYLLNDKIKKILSGFGDHYKLIKSIYFDKPPKANWIVNWHQDLTISVKEKQIVEGFSNWLPKENYFSVQPPLQYLDNIITIRIHLDDCTKENGA